ncbi:phage portal protein, partial [Streptococcus pneumoniae]|uniref:phage portal protein n=1 Tax=Streptococcus pneumoniae TaxID=1313 RepID=UPI0012D82E53
SADGRTRTPRPDHTIARVLSQPNKGTLNQTWPEFAAMLETHRLLRGNGYAWINRVVDPSRPVGDPGRIRVAELLPLHPDKVDVLVPD